MPLLASVVVIVILAAGLGYFYVTSTQTEASLNSSITSQRGQLDAQGSTISSESSAINSQSAVINSLQGNVTAYKALVASLHSLISSDKAEVSALTAKLSTANATIASDAAAIMSENATLTTLKSQLTLASSIEANYTNIISLSYAKSLVSGQSVTIYGTTHPSTEPFTTFSPNFAGYVIVTVASATQTYLLNSTAKPANLNLNGVFESLVFLAPSSSTSVNYFIVPISPGTENSFALLTNSATDGTATVTATYYY